MLAQEHCRRPLRVHFAHIVLMTVTHQGVVAQVEVVGAEAEALILLAVLSSENQLSTRPTFLPCFSLSHWWLEDTGAVTLWLRRYINEVSRCFQLFCLFFPIEGKKMNLAARGAWGWKGEKTYTIAIIFNVCRFLNLAPKFDHNYICMFRLIFVNKHSAIVLCICIMAVNTFQVNFSNSCIQSMEMVIL